MLPQSYELPAAVLIFIGGAVSCFAGYRLFKVVLAIYGFVLGAMLASSTMGITNTAGMVIAAIVGGMIGAAILVFAYFVGIALIGAGFGALVAHVAWTQGTGGDPPAVAVILLAMVGALSAMLLQRYVIIVATAFGGAWTMIVGAAAALGDRGAARAASGDNVWVLYPMSPAPGQRWVTMVWVALGALGAVTQLGVTGRKRT